MKIIFLDIDGVLNYSGFEGRFGKYMGIDSEKLKLVKDIVEKTDAEIVLSSDWRLFDDHIDYINEKLCSVGLQKIIGYTPNTNDAINILGWPKTPTTYYARGPEIWAWLEAHPEVEEFVVIDDREVVCEATALASKKAAEELDNHQVKTWFDTGLTREGANQAIEILCGASHEEK